MTVKQELGPVVMEIMRGAFQSVANEMAVAVELAAYSLAITEGRDFSGSLYDADGSLVSQGEGDLPVHVGTAQHTVRRVMDVIGTESMREDDIYIVNDPFLAGTHVNDVRFVMPLFQGGRLRAFVATTAHWTDVGGMVPGSFCQEGRECYQEGLRITPCAIVREGVVDEQLLGLIKANVRMPYESDGDLRAQLAACRAGAKRFAELVDKYGVEHVEAAMAEIQDYAERVFRAEVAALPDGTYTWEDSVDEDFYTGEPKTVRLTLTVEGDRLVYDFRETDPIALCSINTTYIGTFAAVFVTAKALYSEIPFNAGIMRAIDVLTTPNTIADARPPAAVGGFGATSWEKIACCCLSVYSKIAPDRTIAGSYNLINTYFGGRNPATEREYVCYVWSEGGVGGTAHQDGPSAMQSFFNASTKNIPVEILERSAPILIERYELREDTPGPGRNRGGLGTRRVVRMTETDAQLSICGDRRRFSAPGLLGGSDSTTQTVLLHRLDGSVEDLGVCANDQLVRAGEAIVIESMGGAGFGDPLEREPERVLADLAQQYITPEHARERYGVVVRRLEGPLVRYELDAAETAAARERMRAAARDGGTAA